MNLRAHQHRQQKIIMYAATIMFLVTSSIIFYAVKDGVEYSKASSIHAQSVLP